MKTYPPKPEHGVGERILVKLDREVGGYWDGGSKSRFEFSIEVWTGGYERHESFPWHLRISSWDANLWFRIPPAANPVKAVTAAVHRQVRNYRGTVTAEVLPPRREAA